MHYGPPRRRRARPVADASLEALRHRSGDLAKGWLLALLEEAPLDEAPRIVATDLTREGPRVCEAVLRAIGSDAEQRRLEPDGPLAPLAGRIGELAGAGGPRDTAQAVDALQDVVWAALRSELRDPDPELVSQLAERLAQVTAVLRAAALGEGTVSGPATSAGGAAGVPPLPAGAGPAPPVRASAPTVAAPTVAAPTVAAPPPPPPEPPPAPSGGGSPAGAVDPGLRAWVRGDAPAPAPEALWVGTLADEVARAGSSPLSLLLAELEDADRVLAVEPEPDVTFSEFTQALRRAVRREDILVCETPARAWVIARNTDGRAARALADGIAASVREARPWRGAPMVAGVGYAVLGEDGHTAAELIDAAEQARFAASAGGAL